MSEALDANDVRVYVGDVRNVLPSLGTDSVDAVVTSPPYWRLRDYESHGQIGQEETLGGYVESLVEVFSEVRRVLAPDGTLWLNLGDVYLNGEPKLVPEVVAMELREIGWFLRAKVIWHKPNVVPPSATRHPGLDYETLLMLTERTRHYYNADAVKVPAKWERWGKQTDPKHSRMPDRSKEEIEELGNGERHLRQVWSIPTANHPGVHTAVFPEALVEPCILASTRPGGVVLDPFVGSGTTPVVAQRLGRSCIGIELNPEYAQAAIDRIAESA